MSRRSSGYAGIVNVRAQAVARPEQDNDTQPQTPAQARPRWLVLPPTASTPSTPVTPQRTEVPRVTIDRNLVTDPEAARRLSRF